MESLMKFIAEYEKMKEFLPQMYLHINESRNGEYWRVKVFANDMAIIGDAELLTVQNEDRDETFKMAADKLRDIPSRIAELMELKSLGRKIITKRD